MNRQPFLYRGCAIRPEHKDEPILVGCNNSVNRYLKDYWHIEFPDSTWIHVGTKDQARQYIDAHIYQHCLPGELIPA